MIQTLANWLCIAGFGFTLFTLVTTLNIRGKIDRSLGKQRFLQQREKIVSDFLAVRQEIALANDGGREELEPHLLELRALALQLSHYHIWHGKDAARLKQFIRYISKAYMPDKPGGKLSGKELIMRVDEIVAIVKAQAEV